MRILLCNRNDLQNKELHNPTFFDNDKFFILLKNSAQNDWEIEYNLTGYVIRFSFDECIESEPCQEQKLFSDKQAKRLKKFIENINPKKTLYISSINGSDTNCAAIGEIANKYLNNYLVDNIDDFNFYFKANNPPPSNEYLKQLLEKTFFEMFE
jgi:hypothetical protein